jgi:transketolase
LIKEEGTVIVVLSDGECDEGSNWEGALMASHLGLVNLVAIIDRNRLQSFRDTEETLTLEPLAEKWHSFGWSVTELDGHNIGALQGAIANRDPSRPKLIIANTTKGKGVSFMENNNLWHYKSPTDSDLEIALAELGTQ